MAEDGSMDSYNLEKPALVLRRKVVAQFGRRDFHSGVSELRKEVDPVPLLSPDVDASEMVFIYYSMLFKPGYSEGDLTGQLSTDEEFSCV